eukprot:gene23105-31422_t
MDDSPIMRSPYWLFVVLILLLAGLQYRLWVGDGSLAQVTDLQRQIAEQQGENERLLERNRILEAEVLELKQAGRMSTPDFWVVIPAAGVGARMLADRPKQYLALAGRCLLEHTLDCFLDHPGLKGLVVSLAAEDPYWPTLACSHDPRISRAEGGAERADSVLQGLLRLTELGATEHDWVLVHDAARPNLSRFDLDRLLTELAADPVGGLLAVPVRDTLKRASADGRVAQTVDRSQIWQAYTPQMFRFGALQRALAEALVAEVAITDEASAIEWAGQAPRLIEGRADNLKVTRPEDLEWLRLRWSHKH